MAMATARVNEDLCVSRCICETGRKRHRVPRSIHIPFEESSTANFTSHAHGNNAGTNADTPMPEVDDGNGGGAEEHDADNDDAASVADELTELIEDAEDLAATPNLTVDAWAEMVMFDDEEDEEDEDLDTGLGLGIGNADGDLSESDQDDHIAPQIAIWRLNLTGLSQVHNLYFVAYRNQVHISRPRSCVTNALPATPDLILKPRASAMSVLVGGDIDRNFPHQINHLIVSDLGEEEILLLAFDDGDVIAYYTKHIENVLVQRDEDGVEKPRPIQPFFHENVGKSAWGLAVHKKSRLIAVGSNNHNVTVFIFALTGDSYHHINGADPVELFRNLVKDERGNVLNPSGSSWADLDVGKRVQQAATMENLVRRRDANWRILLETGPFGHNIPNVAITSDANGEADKVAGIDFNGNLWLMEIWRFDQCPHERIEQIHRAVVSRQQRLWQHGRNSATHGWGILVLPERSFMPTEGFQASLGLPENEARHAFNERIGHWIDISRGINYIKDNSTDHPWLRWGQLSRFIFNIQDRRPSQPESWFDFQGGKSGAMTPVRRYQQTSSSTRLSSFGRNRSEVSGGSPSNNSRKVKPRTVLGDGSSILRTYELDLELRSFEEGGLGIMFEHVIHQNRPPSTVLPTMRWSHERLSNLIHVPELSLVVAASMCGRVALVTLTRPKNEHIPIRRGFKVETILPTKSEEDKGLRPMCPLLGVAASPVFLEGSTRKTDTPLAPRRYRIMLHYYDLRILSYELSRDSATDALSVFG